MFESFDMVVFGGLMAPPDMNGLKRLGARLVAMPCRQLFLPWDGSVDAIVARRLAMSPDDILRFPLVTIGHSYGGSAASRLENRLGDHPVAASFKLDPVPIWGWGMNQATAFVVSPNVRLTQFYMRDKATWLPPWSCRARNRVGVSRTVRGGHNVVPNSDVVHADIEFKLQGLRVALSAG